MSPDTANSNTIPTVSQTPETVSVQGLERNFNRLLVGDGENKIDVISTVCDVEFSSHLSYALGYGRPRRGLEGKRKNILGKLHRKEISHQVRRCHLFSQIKFIADQTKFALGNPQFANAINEAAVNGGLDPYPIYGEGVEGESTCLLAEGLRLKGHSVQVREKSATDYAKPLIWEVQAYFATAEIGMLGELKKGPVESRIRELLRSTGENRIAAGKRIRAIGSDLRVGKDAASLNAIITIDDVDYELFLSIRDYAAVVGNGGLKNWAEVAGFEFPDKDALKTEDMDDMIQTAVDKPLETHKYILNDIDLDLIWECYKELFLETLEVLGLEEYKADPGMTIGQTVATVLIRAIAKRHDIDPNGPWEKEVIELLSKHSSYNAQALAKKWDSSESYLSKTDGGRAYNARCKDTALWELLCDIDISGCYGEGQRNQSLAIGCDPVTIRYYHKNRNRKMSLRSLLRMLGVKIDTDENGTRFISDWGELVPGLFLGRVSGKLRYAQNLLVSWFDVDKAAIRDMGRNPYHSEIFDEEKGISKILLREVKHGVISSDILEVLMSCSSKRQFNDLMDKLYVDVFSYYPASEEIEIKVNPETGEMDYAEGYREVGRRYEEYRYRSTCHVKNEKKCKHVVVNVERECRAWYRLPMGDLITNKLLEQRGIAKIKYGKKSPMQTMLKLMINTLYGDMVSPYFPFSNPIVGNNITARARVLAWTMETGFFSRQSITDGGAFALNSVFHLKGHSRGRRIEMEKVAELWHQSKGGSFTADSHQRKWFKLAPLGGSELTVNRAPIVCEFKEGTPAREHKDSDEVIGKTFTNYDLVRNGKVVGGKEWKWCPIPDSNKLGWVAIDKWGWVDDMAMKHLQTLFPTLTVLNAKTSQIMVDKKTCEISYRDRVGQFSFESKDVYPDGGVFRSTADYLMKTPDNQTIKARSHQVSRDHIEVSNRETDREFGELDGGKIVKHNGFSTTEGKLGQGISIVRKDGVAPAKLFLEALHKGDGKGGQNNAVPRSSVVIRQGIVKVGAYKARLKTYKGCGLIPGDSELKAMLFTEFSLSQFPYNFIAQYKGWRDAIDESKHKYGQSIEAWFLNDDGTLKYQEMIDWAGSAVADGVTNPIATLEKERPLDEESRKHPAFDILQEMKLILKLPYWHELISGRKEKSLNNGKVEVSESPEKPPISGMRKLLGLDPIEETPPVVGGEADEVSENESVGKSSEPESEIDDELMEALAELDDSPVEKLEIGVEMDYELMEALAGLDDEPIPNGGNGELAVSSFEESYL
ncbi:hypothetical protein IQ235_13615 [Oscillatoriales cyanobacterium LEGE 11467]|uniref:DNA-directed DNA polymerase n=1 Tax=Zarconia navalis LEGE 11467 TaxID=1828826 RepID=A0A928W0V3_9CYAN|nr:hypothetical protein [Zarconia navalis]MBE9041818.1 hypothetical protein [Zarconia navalis LEGE 11467]